MRRNDGTMAFLALLFDTRVGRKSDIRNCANVFSLRITEWFMTLLSLTPTVDVPSEGVLPVVSLLTASVRETPM